MAGSVTRGTSPVFSDPLARSTNDAAAFLAAGSFLVSICAVAEPTLPSAAPKPRAHIKNSLAPIAMVGLRVVDLTRAVHTGLANCSRGLEAVIAAARAI